MSSLGVNKLRAGLIFQPTTLHQQPAALPDQQRTLLKL